MPPREYFPVLSSTQDRALELARAGAEAGTRVIAGRQSAGRGRHGTRWISPEGGLYVSVLLEGAPPDAGLLPVSVGAHVADAVEQLASVHVRIKWPNDLLLLRPGGRAAKLGGILVDRLTRADLSSVDVIGVGLNRQTPLEGWEVTGALAPTALSEWGTAPSLNTLEEAVVRAVRAGHAAVHTAEGRAEVLEMCRERLWGIGRPVSVDGRPVGRLERLTEEGALRVVGADGSFEVRAGRLTVEEDAG